MKALQKTSKFLSDYTSIVVIAIAVVTFFLPSMMGWVNLALFTDMVSNKFTCQSIIIGIIMFSMGLTLTTEDFKILAQRPFDICVGAAVSDHAIPCICAFKGIEPAGWNRTWADSCRLLSGRCIFQHHVLSVRRGCSLFCRNDNSIHTGLTGYDTTHGIFTGKRYTDYDQGTSDVRINH